MGLHNQVYDEQDQRNGKGKTHCRLLGSVATHEGFSEEEHNRSEQTNHRKHKEHNHKFKVVFGPWLDLLVCFDRLRQIFVCYGHRLDFVG